MAVAAQASLRFHQNSAFFPGHPRLFRNSQLRPPPGFSSARIRASSAVALEPELTTEAQHTTDVDLFACPICYEPLIRKGPSGFNLPAIYRSGFKCRKCNKSYSSKNIYLDLTVTSGTKEYNEFKPAGTELFRSPLVSFVYERGWRQNFNRSGFPGPDEENFQPLTCGAFYGTKLIFCGKRWQIYKIGIGPSLLSVSTLLLFLLLYAISWMLVCIPGGRCFDWLVLHVARECSGDCWLLCRFPVIVKGSADVWWSSTLVVVVWTWVGLACVGLRSGSVLSRGRESVAWCCVVDCRQLSGRGVDRVLWYLLHALGGEVGVFGVKLRGVRRVTGFLRLFGPGSLELLCQVWMRLAVVRSRGVVCLLRLVFGGMSFVVGVVFGCWGGVGWVVFVGWGGLLFGWWCVGLGVSGWFGGVLLGLEVGVAPSCLFVLDLCSMGDVALLSIFFGDHGDKTILGSNQYSILLSTINGKWFLHSTDTPQEAMLLLS
ncbi:UNVERIFIED_CONTAM: putative methyltransferase, chloroplastic [Sesamum calycinum]|uniref:Methyltransferase, chloroplastic n=1 Tax=Sesamum calycinum TaxID=2727403 RepID=A0AAW2N2C0_9LAMI